MAVTVDTRLRSVIGERSAKALAKLEISSVGDLLHHYPRRYLETGAPSDLGGLIPGQHVTVLAHVLEAKVMKFRDNPRRSRTTVTVTDSDAVMELTFFQQPWLVDKLTPGRQALFSGVVSTYKGQLQLTQPAFDLIDSQVDTEESSLARGVLPIYPATAKFSSMAIMRAVAQALDVVEDVPEVLPEQVRRDTDHADIRQALESIHRPHSIAEAMGARKRMKFEEAFVVQTVFAQRRYAADRRRATPRPMTTDGLRTRFEQMLPFTLTDGQREVSGQISADLARDRPMHRLLQGEVGSGKTIVALLAMLQVVDAGGQCALLAPTEVLAAQHFRAVTTLLGDLAAGGMLGAVDGATRVRLLTGSSTAKSRRAALLDVESAAAGIVIGTHALLEDSVQFADLGLVVIDEQHRFGVEQRAALVDRPDAPHALVMTATPIPRTIAMTVFGDLDVSTLTELPAGRQPIQTTVVPAAQKPAWLQRAWQRVREEVAQGRQAYVVASRIGDSESAPAQTRSVIELYAELADGPLQGLRLAKLHGRMAADEKDEAMLVFAAGSVDVLVATTVVEVGVDVPNATVMVIMDAERFGISQLHQLRGRVGRGSEAGLCLLITDSDADSVARERLAAVASTTDGFELSRLDVVLRREGDVLGARQSGVRSGLRLLSVVKDRKIIEAAREAATAVVNLDAQLSEHPALASAVARLEESQQADFLERT